MTEELKKITEHAEQIAIRENCYLYDLQLSGKGLGRSLRVFIDKDGEEGVSIDDCSRVSRGLDLVLDVEDLIPGGTYNLEVSSPGLERQLNQPWHYKKSVGQDVLINLNAGLGEIVEGRTGKDEKRKKLTAKLKLAGESAIEVILEGAEEGENGDTVLIPYEFIHKARVVFTIESNKSLKKKTQSRKG